MRTFFYTYSPVVTRNKKIYIFQFQYLMKSLKKNKKNQTLVKMVCKLHSADNLLSSCSNDHAFLQL